MEVTVTQHRVLVVLAARGDQTVGEIAEALGVHPSNATRYTDRLQRLGLVRRSRSDHDGRVVRVALTPAGHDLLQAVTAKRREDVLEVLGRMTSRETTEAVRALQAFSRAAGEAEERDWAVAPW
ncbi:MAG: MarR family transcriptional regulator [Nocardioides sp.]